MFSAGQYRSTENFMNIFCYVSENLIFLNLIWLNFVYRFFYTLDHFQVIVKHEIVQTSCTYCNEKKL